MPWTTENPPRPAKNWPAEDKEKCVKAANAVIRDGGSDEDAIFACIKAAGRSTKMEDKELSDVIGEEATKEMHWVPYGVTTFQELDAARESYEIVENLSRLNEDFISLAWNALNSEMVVDKASALRQLATDYESRISGPTEEKEIKDGLLKRVATTVKNALGIKELGPSQIQFYKSADGRVMWFARYSNKWRDNDNPPEIISDESHKRFVELVKENLAPFPTLRIWHIKGTDFGRATWVDYTQGFALAAGYVYPGYEKVAEVLANTKGLAMSHGMPISTIGRDPADESIITEHETREISVLPYWAAANKMTAFEILKEYNMSEDVIKGLSPESRAKLQDDMGFPEEVIDLFENSVDEAEKAAVDSGLEFKEASEEVASEDAELEQESVETPAEDQEVEVVSEPNGDEQAESESPDVAQLLEETFAGLKALHKELQAVRAELEAVKDSQGKFAEKMSNTPLASRSDAWTIGSVIGKEDARIDGRSSLAKDGPDESSSEEAGVRFFFQDANF